MPQFGMPQKGEKTKALDLMIAIGTGPKKHDMEKGESYDKPEDMEEEKTEDAMCKCGEPMVCKGCDMPESECECE